jgi:hypothetical protein
MSSALGLLPIRKCIIAEVSWTCLDRLSPSADLKAGPLDVFLALATLHIYCIAALIMKKKKIKIEREILALLFLQCFRGANAKCEADRAA